MLLLKNATVINGDGKSELRHGNILVDGDRIAAVTDRLSDCDKTGWEVIDCTGKIVIPGMITHHTHGLVNGPFWPAVHRHFPRSASLRSTSAI